MARGTFFRLCMGIHKLPLLGPKLPNPVAERSKAQQNKQLPFRYICVSKWNRQVCNPVAITDGFGLGFSVRKCLLWLADRTNPKKLPLRGLGCFWLFYSPGQTRLRHMSKRFWDGSGRVVAICSKSIMGNSS